MTGCSSNCWYWQMPDGSRTYHFDRMTYERIGIENGRSSVDDGHGGKKFPDGVGPCPQCGNEHTNGGTIPATELKKSGTYVPREDEAKADETLSSPNFVGASTRSLLNQQAGAQRAVAESQKWLIARMTNPGRKDSRKALEGLGFKIVRESDDLFYEVEAPEGWTKSTNGYWTTVLDETGNERFTQFFKGAFYDRDAFVNV